MGTAFGWLSDFIYWIIAFIPRIVIVSYLEHGVAYVRGKNVKIWEPGLHIYWPFWTVYELFPTREQVVNLEDQCVSTSDACAVVVGGIVFYKIVNPEKLLGQINDPLEFLSSKCFKVSRKVIAINTARSVQTAIDPLNESFIAGLKEELAPYGVEVLDASFSDLAPCKVFRISGISPSQNTVENYESE